MSRKKKKQVSQAQQRAIAQRELEKGNAKQALKFAKNCYRLDPSEEVRSLLQRALLLRGRELRNRAMYEPARAVIVELDELGEVAAEYRADANRLRVLLGLAGDLTHLEPQDAERLRIELADQSVLEGTSATTIGEAHIGKAVRSALDAAEAGEHARAVELVASISRDSPYCDWKLFVRGLCAYYEEDYARAAANWSRLGENRPPRRMSDALLVLTESRRYADAPGSTQARADALIRSIESPLLGSLRVLQRKYNDPNCDQAELRSELRRFMQAYAKTEPAVTQRVAKIFILRAIKRQDEAELTAIARFLPKLPLDPKLNRAYALLAEGDGELEEIEHHWEEYAADLQACKELSESQKSIATALVFSRIAMHHVQASDEAEGMFGFLGANSECVDALQESAISYYRKSLATNPNLPGVHLAFGRLLEKRCQDKEAAIIFKDLAKRFPDDAESLMEVARHFLARKDPDRAKEYAIKARMLCPRDHRALALVWDSCLGTARAAAGCRQFRLAEAELDEAETLVEAGTRDAFMIDSIRAALAFKEGNYQAAESNLNATIEQFEVPTAALLIVDSQARLCGVPPRDIKSLGERLTKSLKGRKNAQAAGAMSKYLGSLQLTGTKHGGLATRIKQVEKYLNQCQRVKWQSADLIEACEFANLDPERTALLEKLAKRGAALFPDDPNFYFFIGQSEMAHGPFVCDYAAARRAFEQAIELEKTGSISLKELYRRTASRSLSLLESGEPTRSNPFGHFEDDDDDDDDSLEVGPELIQHLIDTMPPEIREQFDKMGLDPIEAMKAIIARQR